VKERDDIMDHLEYLRKDCERLMKSALSTMLKNLTFDHVIEPSEEIYQKIASVTDYQTFVSIHEVNINDDLSPAEKRKKIERIIAKAPKA